MLEFSYIALGAILAVCLYCAHLGRSYLAMSKKAASEVEAVVGEARKEMRALVAGIQESHNGLVTQVKVVSDRLSQMDAAKVLRK